MRTRVVLAALTLVGAAAITTSCIFRVDGVYCGAYDCSFDLCCAVSCGGVDAYDACVDYTAGCPTIDAPVCGCDGLTYANACEAHVSCVAVASDGECGTFPCGGSLCAPGSCCLEGCGGADTGPLCVVAGGPCPQVYDPVCGCDGLTYGNACEAHAACAAIDHAGSCAIVCIYEEPSADGCRSGLVDCPVGGPALRCVDPASYDDCCCPACV